MSLRSVQTRHHQKSEGGSAMVPLPTTSARGIILVQVETTTPVRLDEKNAYGECVELDAWRDKVVDTDVTLLRVG